MQNKNINTHYVYNELKKLKIYDFFCNIQNTLEVWFNNKESSEMTDYITSVIFESGIYGLHEKNIVSNALKEKRITKNIYIGKIHRIFLKTFPPYKSMRRKYQILKKIPAFWIFRLIEALFFKHKDISDNFNEISTVTHTQIDEYEKALKYVGLDYNF
ncbi:MAG: hypothetical protein J6B23_07755, partial [Clostridia bacterium]|nr:hypothetical protein [Clostridia bacterium]